MGQRSRSQEYQYQYKNISLSIQQMCGIGPSMQVTVPDNVIAVKSLWMRVVTQFFIDDEPVENRRYNAIALNSIPGGSDYYDSEYRQVPLTGSADGAGVLDFSIDLTPHAAEIFIYPTELDTSPYFIIGLEPPQGLVGINNRLVLWQMDIIYTIQGIQ